MKGYRATGVRTCDKLPHYSKFHPEDFNNRLRLCGCNYIDIIQARHKWYSPKAPALRMKKRYMRKGQEWVDRKYYRT